MSPDEPYSEERQYRNAGGPQIASSFPGVPATDIPTFTATIGLLGTVAFIACAIPARRAIRVNPITALRHE